jgi:hypothetical protein
MDGRADIADAMTVARVKVVLASTFEQEEP